MEKAPFVTVATKFPSNESLSTEALVTDSSNKPRPNSALRSSSKLSEDVSIENDTFVPSGAFSGVLFNKFSSQVAYPFTVAEFAPDKSNTGITAPALVVGSLDPFELTPSFTDTTKLVVVKPVPETVPTTVPGCRPLKIAIPLAFVVAETILPFLATVTVNPSSALLPFVRQS